MFLNGFFLQKQITLWFKGNQYFGSCGGFVQQPSVAITVFLRMLWIRNDTTNDTKTFFEVSIPILPFGHTNKKTKRISYYRC